MFFANHQRVFTLQILVNTCSVSKLEIYSGSSEISESDPTTHRLTFPEASLVAYQQIALSSTTNSIGKCDRFVTFHIKNGEYFIYPVPDSSQYPDMQYFQLVRVSVNKDTDIKATSLIPL